jgi:hypothetical protein
MKFVKFVLTIIVLPAVLSLVMALIGYTPVAGENQIPTI